MPLLLDTHVLLWLAKEPERLSLTVNTKLNSNEVLCLSHASVWEIAIKSAIKKIELDFPIRQFIEIAVFKHSLILLPISLDHIYFVNQLPLHHRDPFDRLLIAQSLTEGFDNHKL